MEKPKTINGRTIEFIQKPVSEERYHEIVYMFAIAFEKRLAREKRLDSQNAKDK